MLKAQLQKAEGHEDDVDIGMYNLCFPSKSTEYAALKKNGFFLPDNKFCTRFYLRNIMNGSQKCPKIIEVP